MRVTPVISTLNHDDLVHDRLIPDFISGFPLESEDVRKYPLWVYREKVFSKMGELTEDWIKQCMLHPLKEDINDLMNKTVLAHFPHLSTIDSPTRAYLYNIYKWVHNHPIFQLSYEIDIELGDPHVLTGHPDLMGEHDAIDIKTCSKISTHLKSFILQVLSYVALARHGHGMIIKYASLIFPMQKLWVSLDVSRWNSQTFNDLLVRTSLNISQKQIEEKQIEEKPIKTILVTPELLSYVLGSLSSSKTIDMDRKYGKIMTPRVVGSTVYEANFNSKLCPDIPYQIFIRNRTSGACKLEGKEKEINWEHPRIKEYRELLSSGYKCAIHTCYTVNICNPYTKKTVSNKPDGWAIRVVQNDLKVGVKCGFMGVVLHVGKHLNVDRDYKIMYNSIEQILEYASKECPLLLETPCGCGTETGTTIDDLGKIYSRFAHTGKFKICIDTCHVWVCGYHPVEYLTQWCERYPHSVGLVHFNDSQYPRNSHKDRHAPKGRGTIGHDILDRVIDFCTYHDIPMVTE